MKPASALSLALFSAGIALSCTQARADDSTVPPIPPPAPSSPDTSPADGGQAQPRHRRPRGFVLGELTAKLDLTAAQQKTVGGVLAAGQTQMKELRGDDTLSQEDKRARMRGIGESTRAQIRAALTPAQQAIFDTLPANGGRRGHQPPGPTEPPAPTAPPST